VRITGGFLPELYHGLDDRRLVRESTLSGFGVMTVSFVTLRRDALLVLRHVEHGAEPHH